MKTHDISIPINENMIVYPSNEPVTIKQYSSIPKDNVNESWVKLGCHTGTRTDAPRHIDNMGKLANEIPLDTFLGSCQVFDLAHVKMEIHEEHLKSLDIKRGDIILLKTRNSFIGYKTFKKDYVHLKLDAAQFLVEKKIKTLGFDYLSVKKFDGEDKVHEMLINNLTLYEGLDLREIDQGRC